MRRQDGELVVVHAPDRMPARRARLSSPCRSQARASSFARRRRGASWIHEHHLDHGSQQGPRPRGRPPPHRSRPRRLDRRARRRRRDRGRRGARRALRPDRRHRRRVGRRRRRDHQRRRDRPRRPGQQRRDHRRAQAALHEIDRRRVAGDLRHQRLRHRPRHPARSCRCWSESENPVIVNVASGLGSHGVTSDPDRVEFNVNSLDYPSSKAAVNMLTDQYAKGADQHEGQRRRPRLHRHRLQRPLRPADRHRGHRRDRRAGAIGPDGPTGTYSDRHGVVPW